MHLVSIVLGEYTGFMKLLVYTKRGCFWCEELLDFLREKNVKFEEREVLSNEAFFKEMIGLSGQTKAPTVVLGGEVYADTDKSAIEKVLKINKIIS